MDIFRIVLLCLLITEVTSKPQPLNNSTAVLDDAHATNKTSPLLSDNQGSLSTQKIEESNDEPILNIEKCECWSNVSECGDVLALNQTSEKYNKTEDSSGIYEKKDDSIFIDCVSLCYAYSCRYNAKLDNVTSQQEQNQTTISSIYIISISFALGSVLGIILMVFFKCKRRKCFVQIRNKRNTYTVGLTEIELNPLFESTKKATASSSGYSSADSECCRSIPSAGSGVYLNLIRGPHKKLNYHVKDTYRAFGDNSTQTLVSEDILNDACQPKSSLHALPKHIKPLQEKKEKEINIDDDARVSVVVPLTAPADERNTGHQEPRLNWDEIFRYLAKNLPTPDYKLFFNILFGYCHHVQHEGQESGSIIEKVEHKVRRDGGDTETLMFELLNHWKQLMGPNVNKEYIEKAFSERSNNLALKNFRDFMSDPPLLPNIHGRNNLQDLCPKTDISLQCVPRNPAIYILPYIAPQHAEITSASRLNTTSHYFNEPVIEEVEDQTVETVSLTSPSNYSSQLSNRSSLILNGANGERNAKRKRLELKEDSMISENNVIPRKLMKTNKHLVQRKGNGIQRHKETTTLVELEEVTQSLISLMKISLPLSPIPLQAKQYEIFLQYTIDSIIKDTGETRHNVLSLSHEAYCKKEMFKTSRNDTFYFMYVGASCLVLRQPQFENLRLYADFARRKLVWDITERLGEEYKEPDALFLSYDGKACLKKKKAVRHHNGRTEQTENLSSDTNPPTRSTTCSDSSAEAVKKMGANQQRPREELGQISSITVPLQIPEETSRFDIHTERTITHFGQPTETGAYGKIPGQNGVVRQSDTLSDETFDENRLSSIGTNISETQVSDVHVSCDGIDSTTCLGSKDSFAAGQISKIEYTTYSVTASPHNSMQSTYMMDHDLSDVTAKENNVHLREPLKINGNTSEKGISNSIKGTDVPSPFKTVSNSYSEVVATNIEMKSRTASSSDTSFDERPTPNPILLKESGNFIEENETIEFELDESGVDMVGKEMNVSKRFEVSSSTILMDNSNTHEECSCFTAVKNVETQMQTQKSRDIKGKDLFGETTERRFIHVDGPLDANFDKESVIPVKEKNMITKSGEVKGKGDSHKATSESNRKIDVNISASVTENRSCNLECEIIIACLSSLMHSELDNGRKSTYRYMACELD